MPYILQKDRDRFTDIFQVLEAFQKCKISGDVLHLLKYVILIYLNKSQKKYADHNKIIGAITASYLELCRRFDAKPKLDYDRRNIIKERISPLCIEIFGTLQTEDIIITEGDLNYFMSMVVVEHIKQVEKMIAPIDVHKDTVIKNELSYIYSALLFNFYEDYTGPYEDLKITENGDIL